MNLMDILVEITLSTGYVGIFCAIALEYACFPVSSEILLPLIGCVSCAAGFSLAGVIACATVAGVCGSFFCFFMGMLFSDLINKTLCKKFKTLETGINSAQRLFRNYGGAAVFAARLFPIARTYISIPAGMSKMSPFKFALYTFFGALLWNTALISVGFAFGNNLDFIKAFFAENKERVFASVVALAAAVVLAKKFAVGFNARNAFAKKDNKQI